MKKKISVKPRTKSSKKAVSVPKKSLLESYYLQTDEFFAKHRYSRTLLGIYIVVYAVFLGLLFHDKVQAMTLATQFYY